MFVFEDTVYLDNLPFKPSQGYRHKDLSIALKAANPEVAKIIFNMSSECRRPSKQILNIYIMYACVMSKRPSNAWLRLSSSRRMAHWSSLRAGRMMCLYR